MWPLGRVPGAAKPSTRARKITTAATGPVSSSCGKTIAFLRNEKGVHPEDRRRLLKHGKVKIKGLFSPKTGKTYDGTVLLADTGGKYGNFRMEWKK